MSAKAELKKKLFDYLDDRLDITVKKQFSASQIDSILTILVDWIYMERMSILADFSNSVAKKIQRMGDKIEEKSKEGPIFTDFQSELDQI